MDVRGKLVELLSEKCMETCKQRKGYVCSVEECKRSKEKYCGFYADHLISNGVTVQGGKPLDAFLHPVDAYKGLKAKYLVFKADTGERVGNCFVLRPDKDPAAVEAIRAYASATDNETLAEDIYNWVGKGEPVQERISVRNPLNASARAAERRIIMAKCTGRRCPMQVGYKVDECDYKDCPWRTEPITNADRIRAMSDEELVVFLDGFSGRCLDCAENAKNENCQIYKEGHYCRPQDIMEWLKQPSKGE